MSPTDAPRPPDAFKAICGLLANLGQIPAFQPPVQEIFNRRAGEFAGKTGLRPDQLSLTEIRAIAEASAAEYADQLTRTLKP